MCIFSSVCTNIAYVLYFCKKNKANKWWIINHILKHNAWCYLITLPSHLNRLPINEFDSIQHTGSRCHSQLVTSEQFAAHYWFAYNILQTCGGGGAFIKSCKLDCDWRSWQDIICIWRSMLVFLGSRRIKFVWSEINILRLRWCGRPCLKIVLPLFKLHWTLLPRV